MGLPTLRCWGTLILVHILKYCDRHDFTAVAGKSLKISRPFRVLTSDSFLKEEKLAERERQIVISRSARAYEWLNRIFVVI
jgi:hypothetical protein